MHRFSSARGLGLARGRRVTGPGRERSVGLVRAFVGLVRAFGVGLVCGRRGGSLLAVGLCVAIGCSDDGVMSADAWTSLDGSTTATSLAPERLPTEATAMPEDLGVGTTDTGGMQSSGTSLEMPRLDVGPPPLDVPDTLACSADLRSVIWATSGLVHHECSASQGCYEGSCVPACDAAGAIQQALGCEFIVPTPAFYQGERIVTHGEASPFDGPCHAVWVANTWPEPAQLSLRFDGVDLDVGMHLWHIEGLGPQIVSTPLEDGQVPPNATALLLLSHKPGVTFGGASLECPHLPAVASDLAAHASAFGRAMELRSDLPVYVHDILPFGGAPSFLPSASLLYPVSAWGNNYVAVTPVSTQVSPYAFSWLSITAAQDGTHLRVRSTQTLLGSGAFEVPLPGTLGEFELQRSEVVQLMSTGDLSGSVIEADVPVAVHAGHTYLARETADSSGGPNDAAHQQLPHVRQLSHRYVAPGVPTRRGDLVAELVPYRVMAVVDDTELHFEPEHVSPPLVLQSGQAVEFETREAFVVGARDEKPFSFTHYMSGIFDNRVFDPGTMMTRTGCSVNLDDVCRLGDTDWVHLPAPEHVSSRYSIALDPTFGTASVALFRDHTLPVAAVEFSCGEKSLAWHRIGVSEFEYAHVDLYRYGAMSGECASTLHQIRSDYPFGLFVWGLDLDASYGFAAGSSLHALNDLTIPAG